MSYSGQSTATMAGVPPKKRTFRPENSSPERNTPKIVVKPALRLGWRTRLRASCRWAYLSVNTLVQRGALPLAPVSRRDFRLWTPCYATNAFVGAPSSKNCSPNHAHAISLTLVMLAAGVE